MISVAWWAPIVWLVWIIFVGVVCYLDGKYRGKQIGWDAGWNTAMGVAFKLTTVRSNKVDDVVTKHHLAELSDHINEMIGKRGLT